MPERSRVAIAGRSTLHPIHAAADGLQGWLDVTLRQGEPVAEAAVGGHIEIAVDRLGSGNTLVDRETRRRIHARRHPMITGDITAVVAVTDSVVTVQGDIGFRGETVGVEGDLSIAESQGGLVVEGEAVFDVRWWGLEPPKLLALRVQPEIRVGIYLELNAAD